jgi:hypothetical protein
VSDPDFKEGGTVSVLCERCLHHHYTPYGEEWHMGDPYPPALSRLSRGGVGSGLAPIYVCSTCGQDEAMIEFTGRHLQTPDEWPVEVTFVFPVPSERGGV